MKYQKGQELRNANQKEPSLSGLVTNFNVANAQAHRNQLHSGTERPHRNVSIGTFTSYRLTRHVLQLLSLGRNKKP